MMRALYTAASGMRAQQTNVDNISNNIANVNTTAFKSQKTEFKSLLYQTIQTRTTSANGEEKPIGAQDTFVPAPPVGVAVSLPSAFALFKWFPTILREPLSASDTLSEATAPVKLPA